MSTASFPIQLEQLVFVHCEVVSIPGHAQLESGVDGTSAPPVNKINVERAPDDEKLYSVVFTTTVNADMAPTSPYYVHMECMGLFRIDDTLKPDEAKRGVTITGHSVLFGAIRETVAWLTGRQAYGPLLLGLSVLTSKPKPDETNLTKSGE